MSRDRARAVQERESGVLHEAGAAGDHDVLDIRQRLELGAAREQRGVLPDAKVLEEAIATAIGS